MTALLAFIKLGRPLFLGGGFLMFALGAAIAHASGHAIELTRYVLGQAVVTSYQLMTHYANDYFDYEADRLNTTPTKWSGGSRVLPDGGLPRSVALLAAIVLAVIGSALGVWLAIISEPIITITIVAIAILAWTYSAPPIRTCARGLGELTTSIVVTGLVPLLGFALQAPELRGLDQLALSIGSLALLQFAMLLAIEFPDAAGDAAAGKRTLVVQLGAPRASKLYIAVLIAAYAWLPLAVVLGLPGRVALAAAITAPIAIWRIVRIAEHGDQSAHERMTLFAVALLVITSAAELVAWIA